MNDEERLSEDEEEPILSVIQKIKDGLLNPRLLDKETRQNCVEVMVGEGYGESQVAQVLQRSEKTIQRDIQAIHKRNSLTPNIGFVTQLVGDIVKKGLTHHDYLVRISRGKDVSYADKIQAVNSAWKIINELSERLQMLGFMPCKTQLVVSDVYHHQEGGETTTYAQLRQDLQDIERVARETGTLDPKAEEGIKLLQQRIEKAEIVEEIADLNKGKDGEPNTKENNHEQQ